MHDPSRVLAGHLAALTEGRKKRHARAFTIDRTLQEEEVAARRWTTKSAVSRLESGMHTRPTLSTIERYARAVVATVEIRVRIRR